MIISDMVPLHMKGMFLIISLLIMFGWMSMTYQLRTSTMKEKARDYVAAARVLGASTSRILFVHILPNLVAILVTLVPFSVSALILALASLDYLGFGLPDTYASWGRLLNDGLADLSASWVVTSAFSALVITLLLVTFIGEAVREAFDPKNSPLINKKTPALPFLMLKLSTLLRSTLSSVMLSLLLAAGSGCKDSSQSQGVGWQPNVPFGTLPPGFDSFPERWNKQINDRLAREEAAKQKEIRELRDKFFKEEDSKVREKLQSKLIADEAALSVIHRRQTEGDYIKFKTPADIPQDLKWEDGLDNPEIGDPNAKKEACCASGPPDPIPTHSGPTARTATAVSAAPCMMKSSSASFPSIRLRENHSRNRS